MTSTNLVLHCGAAAVAREALASVVVPPSTDTWFPIGHTSLLAEIEKALMAAQMQITSQAHSLTKEGARYFGLMQVNNGQENSDFSYVLGVRNSIDKSFPAGLVVGSQVFVCDNLAFSGEVKIARKHTRFIERDLPLLVGRAIGMLADKWQSMENRIARYKQVEISHPQAHDLLIRSIDLGAATPQQIPAIVEEWRHPRHPEFAQDQSAWRLFNAFTEVAKGGSLAVLPKRTMALHGLLDAQCGFKTMGAEDVVAGTVDAEAQLN
jgi:hypothetical protein